MILKKLKWFEDNPQPKNTNSKEYQIWVNNRSIETDKILLNNLNQHLLELKEKFKKESDYVKKTIKLRQEKIDFLSGDNVTLEDYHNKY